MNQLITLAIEFMYGFVITFIVVYCLGLIMIVVMIQVDNEDPTLEKNNDERNREAAKVARVTLTGGGEANAAVVFQSGGQDIQKPEDSQNVA